jgi:protein-disulfide isomerase
LIKKSASRGRIVFRPVVALAGLSLLSVIILSALHEVSAPSLIAREADRADASASTTEVALVQTPSASSEATSPPDAVQTEAAASEPETAAGEPEEAASEPVQTTSADAVVPSDTTGPLRENAIGAEDAPVTIIEYSSLTCPHCARFHAEAWPQIKAQYVETGKVRFILREFPLDNLAAAGFMLARCVEGDKYFAFVDLLFSKQDEWARAQDPVSELQTLSRQAGFTQARFEACLTDQTMLDHITRVRDEGSERYGVRSTPTFIINGEVLAGNQSFDVFEARIEPLLEEAGRS